MRRTRPAAVARGMLAAVTVALAAGTLSACTTAAVAPGPASTRATAGSHPTPAALAQASRPSPHATPDSAATATGNGCARTAATTPAGAISARVGDLDGDGRADIEWAELGTGGTLHFGITTASGATAGASERFAGGAGRLLVVSRLANGAVAVITSETRDSPLWSFASCRLHAVHGVYDRGIGIGGDQFVFYSADGGGSLGCTAGRLEGYHEIDHGPGRSTITADRVELSRDGLRATTGGTRTLSRAEAARRSAGQRISCGTSPVLRPTYRPHA